MARPCEARHQLSPGSCNLCLLYETNPDYRAAWGGEGPPPLRARPPAPQGGPGAEPGAPQGGPGTELAALLAALGVPEPPGCSCKARAREMDRWGPDGCQARRPEIVAWLNESYAQVGYLARARAAAKAVTSGLASALDWSDPAGSLIDEAIRRARRKAPGWSMLLTGGIGDAFALEAMLSVEERETLGAVYYACPAAREIEQLFRALPNYPRLRDHVVLPTGRTVHYSADAVARQVGPLPPGVRDFSIARAFAEGRAYRGSSFLTHPLCPRPVVGRPYAVVVPHSTWGRWPGRDFDAADWRACRAVLERHDLFGLVLCRERLGLPDHPNLLDWQGRTSILESVELLKGAQGYLGVDSGLSVLAAKLFPASRLSVKSVWSHCYQHAGTYFAPRQRWDFLTRELREPSWA